MWWTDEWTYKWTSLILQFPNSRGTEKGSLTASCPTTNPQQGNNRCWDWQEFQTWALSHFHNWVFSAAWDKAWWCHQMETFSVLLALCAGNSPVTASQRAVTQSFDVFFDLCLNKRLNKQLRGWWFETPSHSLWRLCNGMYVSKIASHYLLSTTSSATS